MRSPATVINRYALARQKISTRARLREIGGIAALGVDYLPEASSAFRHSTAETLREIAEYL